MADGGDIFGGSPEFTEEDRIRSQEARAAAEAGQAPGSGEKPVDEELPPAEGAEGEEGGEGPPMTAEEAYVKVHYETDDGEVEEEISEKELGGILKEIRGGAKFMSKGDKQFIDEVTPIVKNLEKSKVLQMVNAYVERGETDERLIEYLGATLQQHLGKGVKPQEMPEFETEEERINYLVNLKLEERLHPLETQMKQTEEGMRIERVKARNEQNMVRALSNIGKDPDKLTEDDRNKLVQSLVTFVGSSNPKIIEQIELKPDQANMIVKDALKRGEPSNKAAQAQAITRQANVPRTLGGTRSAASKPQRVEKVDGVSERERHARLDGYLDKL
jgi:hypothetical protein